MKDSNQVVVLLYTHKHGMNVGVYKEYVGAKERTLQIITDNRDSFEIDKTLTDEYCFDNWGELTDYEESFEITHKTLHASVTCPQYGEKNNG